MPADLFSGLFVGRAHGRKLRRATIGGRGTSNGRQGRNLLPRSPRPPRPQRWHEAIAELLAVQSECAAWLDALPEALRDGATGQALQAIVDLDLDELASIEPPRGFGRD
jgi:hypothetical protein